MRSPVVTVVPLEQAGVTPDPHNARLHRGRWLISDTDGRRVHVHWRDSHAKDICVGDRVEVAVYESTDGYVGLIRRKLNDRQP